MTIKSLGYASRVLGVRPYLEAAFGDQKPFGVIPIFGSF